MTYNAKDIGLPSLFFLDLMRGEIKMPCKLVCGDTTFYLTEADREPLIRFFVLWGALETSASVTLDHF